MPRRARYATRAHATIVLVGVQPVFTQVPPSVDRSISRASGVQPLLGASPHTIRAYRTAVGAYLGWLGERGVDWTRPARADLRSYLTRLGTTLDESEPRRRGNRTQVEAAFKYVAINLIASSPAFVADSPSTPSASRTSPTPSTCATTSSARSSSRMRRPTRPRAA